MNKVDWSRPYKTRFGMAARLLGEFDSGDAFYRVIAARDITSGHERLYKCDDYGQANTISDDDIINVPERVLRWVNVYDDPEEIMLQHPSEEMAIRACSPKSNRIGIVKLTIEDGKLVSSEVVE